MELQGFNMCRHSEVKKDGTSRIQHVCVHLMVCSQTWNRVLVGSADILIVMFLCVSQASNCGSRRSAKMLAMFLQPFLLGRFVEDLDIEGNDSQTTKLAEIEQRDKKRKKSLIPALSTEQSQTRSPSLFY